MSAHDDKSFHGNVRYTANFNIFFLIWVMGGGGDRFLWWFCMRHGIVNRISYVFSNVDSSALVVNFEDKDKNNL